MPLFLLPFASSLAADSTTAELSVVCMQLWVLQNAQRSLDKVVRTNDESFVCETVLTYLQHEDQSIDALESVQASIDNLARPAEQALVELEQLVGIGDDWHYGKTICSRFLSIRQMFCDVIAGAMLEREELCQQYS